jgi:hypothetical protein
MKIVNDMAGKRSVLLLSESAQDGHFVREMMRLLREHHVLTGRMEQEAMDDFPSLRIEELEP